MKNKYLSKWREIYKNKQGGEIKWKMTKLSTTTHPSPSLYTFDVIDFLWGSFWESLQREKFFRGGGGETTPNNMVPPRVCNTLTFSFI